MIVVFFKDPHQPTLLICYENGRMQIMKDENDDEPVCIGEYLHTIYIQLYLNPIDIKGPVCHFYLKALSFLIYLI